VRRLIITESFGFYSVQSEHYTGTGTTLETALENAFRGVTSVELKIHNNHEAAEALEELLGDRKRGDIIEGVVAA
jgi:hypothetical protein